MNKKSMNKCRMLRLKREKEALGGREKKNHLSERGRENARIRSGGEKSRHATDEKSREKLEEGFGKKGGYEEKQPVGRGNEGVLREYGHRARGPEKTRQETRRKGEGESN